MASTYSSAPYPGLRPFETDESDIFFGREEQTDELLNRLQSHHFLAVVGPSGCGKSSLVRAGMVAALKTGFMCDAGPDWHIVQIRPGEKPMGNLAAALLKIAPSDPGQEADLGDQLLLEAALERGPLGLVEVTREMEICREANLLILVDQFEELFRFRERIDPDEADAFVSLLLATAAQRELPIFVVITMRSDYIGHCAVFQGLPEAINAGQYLTPRLTREQCADAICGPMRVFGGDVEERLLNRLLNDFGSDPDKLPVFQHVLMRMWQLRKTAATKDGAVQPVLLTLEDYESPAIGGLQNALSKHANGVLAELAPEQQQVAQAVFRRLVERQPGRPEARSPARMDEVAKIAGVRTEDVKPVVEAFRRSDRCFLTPREGEPLQDGTILDISHESLIRYWDTLSKWADLEAELAGIYARLKLTAGLWKQKQAALWGPPDLDRALDWRRKAGPSRETWALRYGSQEEFQTAMEFLALSEKEQRRQEEEAREKVQQKIRRAHRAAIIAIAITAIVVVAVIGWSYLRIWEYTACYNDFAKVRGIPLGIGKLSSSQVQRRPVSLRIVRQGRWGRVLRMETVNRNGELTARHSIGTYLESYQADQMQPKEVIWEFTYDSKGEVAQETAFDIQKNRLWGFVYLPQTGEGRQLRRGYFVGRDGYPRAETKYSGNIVEIEYDPTGYEVIRRYRSRGLKPVRGPDKVFGQRREYDREGRVTRLISLGPEDEPLDDEFGNAVFQVTRFDSMGNANEGIARDASGEKVITKEGWAIWRAEYDGAGNSKEVSYYDPANVPTSGTAGYHRTTLRRDGHGNIVEQRYWNAQGLPAPDERGCFYYALNYDDSDNLVQWICHSPDDKPAYGIDGYAIWKGEYDSGRNLTGERFFDPEGKPVLGKAGYAGAKYRYDKLRNRVADSYFMTDGSPAVCSDGYSSVVRKYDDLGRILRKTFFGTDGRPVLIKSGYASLAYEYDSFGNIALLQYFGANGEPAIASSIGVAGWKARHDAGGREIEVVYLDVSGKPMHSNEGLAGFRREYDEAGNESKYYYIGLNGEYVPLKGIAGWTSHFDILGNETARNYFDQSGAPAVVNKSYTQWTAGYDKRGNLMERLFRDARGNLAMAPWEDEDTGELSYPGRARITFRYNSQNKLIEEAYFGKDGKPATHPNGYARATHDYDPRGNRIKTIYYRNSSQPAVVNGYTSLQWRYDDQGHEIDIQYFDKNGKPVSSINGYARICRKHDQYGRLIEEKVLNDQDKPAVAKGGFHRTTRQYDSRGRLIESADFGRDDRPAINDDGYHIVRYAYDLRGNISEVQFLGKNREPVLYKGNHAKRKIIYDARLQRTEVIFFNLNGAKIGSWHYVYDKRGNRIQEIWLDQYGQPVP